MPARAEQIVSPDPDAARALAASLTSQKRTPNAPRREQFSGRLDRNRLARLASGDRRVFERAGALGPRKVRAHVLMDASGSMVMSRLIVPACQLAMNLAAAFEMLPMVTGRVTAFTSPVRSWGYQGGSDWETVDGVPVVSIFPLWRSGEPIRNLNDYQRIDHQANDDGWALAWVGDELTSELRHDESGIILVLSDGEPTYPSGQIPKLADTGDDDDRSPEFTHVHWVADGLRKRGITVVSVSLARDLSLSAQEEMYGKGNAIPFNKDYRVLARSIAKAIGRQL